MRTTGKHVLIIDDDEGTLESFARMLRLSGYTVSLALDVTTAWRKIVATPPDAILLDLRMPILDGLAFLRRLRATDSRRHTPVAVITGDYFIEEKMMDELRELDAVVCFKPLWIQEILKIVQNLLRTAH